MAVCSHCEREVTTDDLFCQFCGLPLASAYGEPIAFDGGPAAPPPQNEALDAWPPDWNGGSAPVPPAAPSEATGPAEAAVPASAHVAVGVAVAEPQMRLVVYSGITGEEQPLIAEQEFMLDGRDVAIGRSPSCDVPLAGDQLASRRHALLRYRAGRYTLVDLGSSNGTYVNDREIREEVVLQDGDRIRVGSHEIVYSTTPAGPGASLAGEQARMPALSSALQETSHSMDAIILPAYDEAPEPPTSAVQDEPDAHAKPYAAPEPAPDAAETPAATEPAAQDNALDALREQLSAISEALALRAEAEAQAASHLRAAVAEIRDQLTAALAESGDVPVALHSTQLSELITVARQAADNPRHLDYVSRLAEHAGQIADALEMRPAMEPDARLRATVEGLLARIQELLA
jgi:pSer/pThr/pTyr-binding forkhead associated (FHA) protein/plasmid stability protein